jgi:hypothetical protein
MDSSGAVSIRVIRAIRGKILAKNSDSYRLQCKASKEEIELFKSKSFANFATFA